VFANFYKPYVAGASLGGVIFNSAIGGFFAGPGACLHIGWQTDWDAGATVASLDQWGD
jgi:hypothetical protein